MPAELRGAGPVTEEARLSRDRARFATPVLIDGKVGALVAPPDQPTFVVTFTITDGLIAGPTGLAALHVVALKP